MKLDFGKDSQQGGVKRQAKTKDLPDDLYDPGWKINPGTLALQHLV